MEIVIGATPSVGTTVAKTTGLAGGYFQARVLNVRPPRRRSGPPPDGQKDRRGKKNMSDPRSSRVMVLLIPDGHRLPKDIESGNYRVTMRFTPQKK